MIKLQRELMEESYHLHNDNCLIRQIWAFHLVQLEAEKHHLDKYIRQNEQHSGISRRKETPLQTDSHVRGHAHHAVIDSIEQATLRTRVFA